jgi:thioredoxin reductase (NADPH)
MQKNKILVIGSGPAGYTAAIYASRGGYETTVISGNQPGGQLTITTEVENFPGFSKGVLGPSLMEEMKAQAQRFGSQIIDDEVTSVDFRSRPFTVKSAENTYSADAIIIATGASAMWLGLDSEQRLRGRGVSACATCDGFFFKNKDVVVVGGGDTALEEANFLTRFAKSVTIVHRRDAFKASRIMQQKTFSNPKIKFSWNSAVKEVLGESKVEGVSILNTKDGSLSTIKCDGIFVAIGHRPNTEVFHGILELNEKGYIVRKSMTMTNIEGVFVAGDVCDYEYRQAITAAGYGCEAGLDAIRWLEKREGYFVNVGLPLG